MKKSLVLSALVLSASAYCPRSAEAQSNQVSVTGYVCKVAQQSTQVVVELNSMPNCGLRGLGQFVIDSSWSEAKQSAIAGMLSQAAIANKPVTVAYFASSEMVYSVTLQAGN